jgi:hypothetical protein
MGSDRLLQDGIMSGKRLSHRSFVLFPALGAALDVGEEERYGSGGKRSHARTFALIATTVSP